MPFSVGERNCLGQPLANIEGPLVLAHIVKNLQFELTTDSSLELHYAITLKPKGIKLNVQPLGLYNE